MIKKDGLQTAAEERQRQSKEFRTEAARQYLIHACFCGLAQFHTFPSACQVPLANPILLSTSDPSNCVLIFPPRYTKFSVCSNSCPSTSRRNFLFPSPRNWHSVFCMIIALTGRSQIKNNFKKRKIDNVIT